MNRLSPPPQLSKFNSIPAALWWCVVTMVTVGYGDVYPLTPAGKIIAGVVMIFGVLVLAMPISVIGANFTHIYSMSIARERKKKRCVARGGAVRQWVDDWVEVSGRKCLVGGRQSWPRRMIAQIWGAAALHGACSEHCGTDMPENVVVLCRGRADKEMGAAMAKAVKRLTDSGLDTEVAKKEWEYGREG